jgi:dihydrofolate reductase
MPHTVLLPVWVRNPQARPQKVRNDGAVYNGPKTASKLASEAGSGSVTPGIIAGNPGPAGDFPAPDVPRQGIPCIPMSVTDGDRLPCDTRMALSRGGTGMLIYSAITSLDGYTADADGKFDWAAPDEEVHAFINDLERGIGTHLYGRRMYEVMLYWETVSLEGQRPGPGVDFAAIWRSADKIVYSTTLRTASSARTRIEPRFDPEAVRALKQHGDVSVGGPGLAASAIRAGLVDQYQLFVTPMVVGGGTSVFPDGVRAGLDLVDQHRFASGVVYLRYRPRD